MANKFGNLLSELVPKLGQDGVDKVAGVLDEQAEKADAPWKKALINLVGDSIAEHGPEGVKMASEAIENLMEGKKGTRLSDLTDDLETASDLLAALQNKEADRKTAARKILMAIGQTLATITKGFIKGL